MSKAFIITATTKTSDGQRCITAGDQIYASNFHWTPTLSGATWFDTRLDAIDIVAGNSDKTNFLTCGSILPQDWKILELDYDLTTTTITDAERDNVIRRIALSRLSPEERRVLGLS